MTNINFRNKKTKTATTIISALVIGLVMLSPITMLPNANAVYETSNGNQSMRVNTNNTPQPLSQKQLIQAENIMLGNDTVKKLIDGKPYTMGADGFIGNVKQFGIWNPVLKLVVDNKLQYAVGVNLTNSKAIKIVEGPTIGNIFGIQNSNSHDVFRDGNVTPVGIQMDTTEPFFTRNPNYNYTAFLVNALMSGSNTGSICTPSQGVNNYWMQSGLDFNTQASPSVTWTDTFYSCQGQPTLISYASGRAYNFTITTDQPHSQWTTTITDGLGNVYTVSDTGMSKYTLEVVGAVSHTSVWFENSNTATSSPGWDSQFTYDPSATAKIKPQGSGWTNWTVEFQGQFQGCSTNQTPSVISGGLDFGGTAKWSMSTMRQYYPAC